LCRMADQTLRGDSPEAKAPPVEVLLHIDAATLVGETSEGNGVPAGTCRQILCDAGVVPVLHAEGRIIDAGRKKRTVSTSLRRAVRSRDRGCTFPSCTYLVADAHHVRHWLDGGETTLENLTLLCPHHHTLLHEGAFSVERGP